MTDQFLSPPILEMNQRAARVKARSNVTHITGKEVFHPRKGWIPGNRDPSESILPLLKQHKGQTILLQVYRNGKPRKHGTIQGGDHAGERYSMRQIYQVPNTDKEINQAFRGKEHEGWFWHWRHGSDPEDGYHLREGDSLKVFPVTELRPQRHRQRFANGINHCVFHPILQWAEARLAEVTNKTERSRMKGLVNEVIRLRWMYVAGVPEHKLQSVVDALGKYRCIHITIELPFSTCPFGGPKIIDVESRTSNTGKKAFHFVNTAWDHVDFLVDTKTIECDQEELDAQIEKLNSLGKFYLYTKAPKGITSISTLAGTFRLKSPYTEAVRTFEEETGLNALKIDAIKQPILSRLVEASMHYNLPGLNCSGFTPAQLSELTDITNLDRIKSYASHYKCHLYHQQEMFPSKFTSVGRLDHLSTEDALTHPGCYIIDQLDWSQADPKFAEACRLLKNPYRNLNVYPRPDLRYMLSKGVTFKVLEGAWAAGVQPYFDFRFPDAMLEKDDGISRYAKWEGACNSIRKYKTYHLKGTKKWFENLSHALEAPDGTRVRWYDNDQGAGTIEVPKASALHLTQITSWCNAYERIDVLEQLLNMDLDQVLWIDKDSICVRKHEFDFDEETWRLKDLPSFKNEECPVYVSNLWQEDDSVPPEHLPADYVPRSLSGAHGCFGVGGGGKTHVNLTDPCLLACGVCYIPPSYLLLEDKRTKLGVNGAVMAVALGKNEDKWRVVERSSAVLVWDEVSQWSMAACHQAIKRFPHHLHIFCGDPGYQLPYIGEEAPFTIAGFQTLGYPITRYDWSYRITNPSPNDPLRLLCNSLRAMMDQGATTETLLEHVANSIPRSHVITAQDVVETRYRDIEETVLCSTNLHLQEYNSALKERQWHGVKLALAVGTNGLVGVTTNPTRKRKFRVLEGSKSPPNGTISIGTEPPCPKSEERYASTVHDYQGRDTDKPIYIDTRQMFAREHPYTAVSRAKSIEQLFLVVGTPEPPSAKYQRTKIYRIRSPHTDQVYLGMTTSENLKNYFKGHLDRKRTSRHVIDCGDAFIELIEAWPCSTQLEAEAREQFWINQTPSAVNKLKPKAHRSY
tara:strand:- start:1172 stop:4417 length:3246 start_codon:yes stop_codon:yes gene_type:complete